MAIALTLGALFVALLIGVPAGIAVGVRPRGWLARAIDMFNATAIAEDRIQRHTVATYVSD